VAPSRVRGSSCTCSMTRDLAMTKERTDAFKRFTAAVAPSHSARAQATGGRIEDAV
jgi:hypothetical protein